MLNVHVFFYILGWISSSQEYCSSVDRKTAQFESQDTRSSC